MKPCYITVAFLANQRQVSLLSFTSLLEIRWKPALNCRRHVTARESVYVHTAGISVQRGRSSMIVTSASDRGLLMYGHLLVVIVDANMTTASCLTPDSFGTRWTRGVPHGRQTALGLPLSYSLLVQARPSPSYAWRHHGARRLAVKLRCSSPNSNSKQTYCKLLQRPAR